MFSRSEALFNRVFRTTCLRLTATVGVKGDLTESEAAQAAFHDDVMAAVNDSRSSSDETAGFLQYDRALLKSTSPGSFLSTVGSSRGDTADELPPNQLSPRRWCREASEICVEHVLKSKKLLNDFVVTYRWSDPHWAKILALPVGNPIGMEMRARHCNYALKHLVQQGHAFYAIQHTKHSVLHPYGIAERSYVESGRATVGDRLVTQIFHEGPLDSRLPLEESPRGVVAISTVQGLANGISRREMLLERSRRIGALQAEVGAQDWELIDPVDVGRKTHDEVMVLAPSTEFFAGGMTTKAIVSSAHVARHPFHFTTDFEAPASTVIDAVHQACHRLAKHHELVKPTDTLHLLGGTISSRFPFTPVENDLHFKMQLSRPEVMHSREQYPSTTLGAPLVDGAPIFAVQFGVFQGVENYLYDDQPSSRPMKWWQQASSLPYFGNLYFCRDANVAKLRPFEDVPNPFERSYSARERELRSRYPGLVPHPTFASGAPASLRSAQAKMHAEAAVARGVYSSSGAASSLHAYSEAGGDVTSATVPRSSLDAFTSAIPPNETVRKRMSRSARAMKRLSLDRK